MLNFGIGADFFSETKTFSHFFLLLGEIQVFISLKMNPNLQKWFFNYLMFRRNFGFGPFYDGRKITHAIGNYIYHLKNSFVIGYGIGRKYLPI